MKIGYALRAARAQRESTDVPFHQWVLPDGVPWTLFFRVASGYLLRFPGLADFEISVGGTQVQCWPVERAAESTIEHLYLNQVLPLALSRTGRLMFHASAVVIPGGCIAFLGESGKGKSTLAASFAASGHSFLTDDGLSVSVDKDGCQVLPGHPSIRLWQSSQDAIIRRGVLQAPPVEYTRKARHLAGESLVFCQEPQTLRCVYILGADSVGPPTFERLSPSHALMELVRHSFLLDIERKETLALHFDELAAMVRLPMYFRLDYPRRFEHLDALRAAIIAHALRRTSETAAPSPFLG